jgi:hypothetical protein
MVSALPMLGLIDHEGPSKTRTFVQKMYSVMLGDPSEDIGYRGVMDPNAVRSRDVLGLSFLESNEVAGILALGTSAFFKMPITTKSNQAVELGRQPTMPIVAVHIPVLTLPSSHRSNEKGRPGNIIERDCAILGCVVGYMASSGEREWSHNYENRDVYCSWREDPMTETVKMTQ